MRLILYGLVKFSIEHVAFVGWYIHDYEIVPIIILSTHQCAFIHGTKLLLPDLPNQKFSKVWVFGLKLLNLNALGLRNGSAQFLCK